MKTRERRDGAKVSRTRRKAHVRKVLYLLDRIVGNLCVWAISQFQKSTRCGFSSAQTGPFPHAWWCWTNPQRALGICSDCSLGGASDRFCSFLSLVFVCFFWRDRSQIPCGTRLPCRSPLSHSHALTWTLKPTSWKPLKLLLLRGGTWKQLVVTRWCS